MEPIPHKDTFTRLYDTEADSVYRFCLFRTSDKEIALDLMQDTFMRFWDTLVRGEREIQNDRALLFAIARNSIIDWYRKKKSLSLESLAEKSEVDVETFLGASEASGVEMAFEAKQLMEKIQKLGPREQQVVYLRYVEGLGPKEIAQVVGESVNAVSVRIHRGVQQLKKIAGYDENYEK